MKKIILLFLALAALNLNAQMKVGANPTTINSNANIQVEATTGQQFIITRDSSKVGIGTLVPSARLHVIDTTGNMPLRLEGLASGNVSTDSVLVTNSLGIVRRISPSVLGAGSEPWFNSATNAGATSNTQNIYQMGRVGIGTNNPVFQLDQQTSSNTATLNAQFVNANGGTSAESQVGIGAGPGAWARIVGYNDALGFRNYSTGKENLTIRNGSGNVGIGIVNPTAKLEVDGSLSTKLNVGIGSVRISMGGTTTSGYIEFFNPNSTTRAGYIGNANSGNLQYNAENGNRHYFLGGGIYVATSQQYSVPSFVFYSNTVYTSGTNGFYTGVSGASTNGYSIYAVDRIACAEVNIFSDKRIKNVIGTSNANQDLATLMKLSIKDYTMKDFIQNGGQKFKKVIAQEVEEVYPLAVSQSTNFIPNVFAPAKTTTVQEGMIELSLPKEHQLKVSDSVKVYIAGKEKIVTVASISSEKSFKVKNQDWSEETLKDVFVYGKLVHDFKTVDYDALSMLNISATQELYRKIEALEKQNEQLQNIQKAVLELKAEINNIKSLPISKN
jgi:hypothetical protein